MLHVYLMENLCIYLGGHFIVCYCVTTARCSHRQSPESWAVLEFICSQSGTSTQYRLHVWTTVSSMGKPVMQNMSHQGKQTQSALLRDQLQGCSTVSLFIRFLCITNMLLLQRIVEFLKLDLPPPPRS